MVKAIREMTIKFLYDLYYVGKTGNVGAAIKDAVYEFGSWFIPTSVLDLTNRYLRRAEKDTVKYAINSFFKKVYGLTSKKEKIKEKKLAKEKKEKGWESYLEPVVA